ncbi:MAG: hypothetical protein WA890_28325 [Micromonospora sp.]
MGLLVLVGQLSAGWKWSTKLFVGHGLGNDEPRRCERRGYAAAPDEARRAIRAPSMGG